MISTLTKPRLVRTGSLGPLSDSIIHAEQGKFYVYSSTLTAERSLYALLDCKANKSRPFTQAGELGREVHLHFGFKDTATAQVSSIKTVKSSGLLGNTNTEFDDVWIAPTNVAIEDFYVLCAQQDSKKLMDICKGACHEHAVSTDIVPALIVAVMTSAGKYGLFLVTELTKTSVSIEACHVLSP